MSTNPDEIRAQVGHVRTVRNPNGSSEWTGKVIAYIDQPSVLIETPSGSRMALAADWMEIPKPLELQVADLLDEEHGPCISEGGCDFRAQSYDQRSREVHADDVVRKIIELVRQHDAAETTASGQSTHWDGKGKPEGTCVRCGGGVSPNISGAWIHDRDSNNDHMPIVHT